MNALIKHIQKILEEGKPVDIKESPLASKVLKEMQKNRTKP